MCTQILCREYNELNKWDRMTELIHNSKMNKENEASVFFCNCLLHFIGTGGKGDQIS